MILTVRHFYRKHIRVNTFELAHEGQSILVVWPEMQPATVYAIKMDNSNTYDVLEKKPFAVLPDIGSWLVESMTILYQVYFG